MIATTHTINKVFVEVNTNNKETAYTLKDNLAQFLAQDVFPFVEKEMDKMGMNLPADVVQIKKLEVTIDQLKWDKQKLKMTGSRRLRNAVIKQIQDIVFSAHPVSDNVTLITKEESLLNKFFHFLEQGTTSWQGGRFEVNMELLSKLIANPFFKQKFKFEIQNKTFRNRFFNQLKIEEIETIIDFVYQDEIGNKDAVVKLKEKIKELQNEIETDSNTQESVEVKSETPQEFFLQNAGLVILHPYLKSFFETCGLLNPKNEITNKELAVHLLHYLATNKEEQTENNLVFEKFLCGIPITQSIKRNVMLSNNLKEKANDLLLAIITNWPALKNASVELLQNEFLQRSGKIDLTTDAPKITIERKTQDILLDKLPWGFGMFKLAWKEELIMVAW